MAANFIKQSVKKTGKERKEKLVAQLTEKIDSSNGLVFTDYKGITHQQLEILRKELKSTGSSIIIAKNSLINISLGKSKEFSDYKDNEALVGPSAMLFVGDDSIEPLKKLQKSIKDAGLPKIKFGILEGLLLDEAGVIKLASLPGREILLTQLVAMLNSPIQGFVTGLNAIPQKFVMTLDAIASAKQNAKPADAVQENVPAKPADEVATEVQSDNSASDSAVASDATPTADNTPEPAPVDGKPADATVNKPVEATGDEKKDEAKPEDQTTNESEEPTEEKQEVSTEETNETEESAKQTKEKSKIETNESNNSQNS